ncbi:MAG: DTW domain-containing protein [Halomonas sp.]|uniref:tRNA-uridine aminocarboxypropyltransferase n=1 Tax=Billgrantia tianxiuensis TaxID=2497861 RepID=A0A6I6SRQ3_9GAMM|nr:MULTISPECIES: DTW domain-containing protein [Halomonas]MCE8033864.1 DTW domain-containing protein [Halomonas sp. MCCC 1A11057]MDX5434473.1 DTW domain-containing protein [Halomonas sp.]MDX5503988.1 DTW domain-containing protein [Halomonas sp.]QHC51416.1 DTW domain-containing protein [Halomonas tianxiuensis]
MLDETGQADLAERDSTAGLGQEPAPGLSHDPATGLVRDPGTGHPRPPRREFKARGSFTERCLGCNLPVLNCLCPYRVNAGSESRVWLITHPLEHLKPTNTGRLIRDVLPETEVFTWYRTTPDERLLALLDDPCFSPFVIFPDDQPDYADRVVGMGAVGEAKASGKTPVFILLDGTWRQARRIFRKSPYLDRLPVLPLATSRLTRYQLRKPASRAHLCTAEVAAELLRQSGDAAAAQVLDDYFDAFNVSYAASRRYEKIEQPTPAMRRLLSYRGQ